MASNYRSVRGVVFDAVGTLIFPDPPAAVVYHGIGQQHGSRLTEDDVARNFNRVLRRHAYESRTNEQTERSRWRRIVADVFTDLDDTESLFSRLWNHFSLSTNWAVYPETACVLAELHSRGLTTAIASNFDERLFAIVRELAPLDRLQPIFVSSQLGFTKPSVEFFRAIEANLHLQPSQLLMVGNDMINDIKGAFQAGWYSLLLDRDGDTKAEETIQSLCDVTSLLP